MDHIMRATHNFHHRMKLTLRHWNLTMTEIQAIIENVNS